MPTYVMRRESISVGLEADFFIGRMPVLLPNQQSQSTEGIVLQL